MALSEGGEGALERAMATVQAGSADAQASAQQRLLALEQQLNLKWLRKNEMIRAALVALVARQHMIVLGPPGEAKSAVIDDVRARIVGTRGFKYVLNKYTTPDEVFGPIDLLALKRGSYERVTANYYSEADIVFMDETGKASSSLSNSFLQSMNEREVVVNGKTLPCRHISFFGASNEALDKKELGAFWDRFGLRTETERLRGPDLRRFLEYEGQGLYAGADEAGRATLTLDELAALQRRALPGRVVVPQRLYDLYEEILHKLSGKGLPPPSTRRSGWNMHLVRASAVLHGRDRATETDLAVLQSALWDNVKDRKEVQQFVLRTAAPRLADAQDRYNTAVQIESGVLEFWADPKNAGAKVAKNREAIEARGKVADELMKIRKLYEGAKEAGDDTAELATLLKQTYAIHLNLKGMANIEKRDYLEGIEE